VKEEKNSKCTYSNYECSTCVENATLVKGVCECSSGYSGVGYIECTKEEKSIEGEF